MQLGIFSDVHDHRHNLELVYGLFQKHSVREAFFCGDLVSPFTLKNFMSWKIPVHAVYGNNEGDKLGFVRRLKDYHLNHIDYQKSGLTWTDTVGHAHLAVFHGHDPVLTQALVKSGLYDFVFSGHTHEPQLKKVNATLWVNPGSVAGLSENPNIRAGSCAIVDTDKKTGIIEIL